MKGKAALIALTFTSLLALAAAPVSAEFTVPRILLAFHTMYAVDGPFLGSENAIRGLPGDDLPWEIERVRATLWSNGRIRVLVKGLVFADDESVPEELRGTNDASEFRAIVSCIGETEEDTTEIINVPTRGFPATVEGNSFIDDKITLPEACVAPILFIAPGDEEDWFAVTGVEVEQEDED